MVFALVSRKQSRLARERVMDTRAISWAGLAVAAIMSLTGVSAANAADISVISSTAMREVLEELVPMFERASGHKVKIDFHSGVDVSAKVRGGAATDLVITTGTALDELMKDGKVVDASRVD